MHTATGFCTREAVDTPLLPASVPKQAFPQPTTDQARDNAQLGGGACGSFGMHDSPGWSRLCLLPLDAARHGNPCRAS
jgi:hypothetical protein